MTREIYLDANATTRVLPQAAKAAMDVMGSMFGNPSSSHITGLRARYVLESSRTIASRVLGTGDGRVIFTSGATEAIQTAVVSALCSVRDRGPTEGRRLLHAATEHKAVPECLQHWNRILGLDAEIVSIPVDARGQPDLEFIARHAKSTAFIATMAVNNETGVISDLAAIERALREENPDALWLVDCVQALAKIDLQLADSSIDYAVVSGHKLYAAKGVGLLYASSRAPLTPLIAGGGQEKGLRSGTENLPGVAAFGEVLRLLDEGSDVFQDASTLCAFRERIVASLRETFPRMVINTPFEVSVPTTINFAVEGLSSKEILDLFDAADIRVSSGSACGSGSQQSYVLMAMGLPQWRCDAAVRLSFGPAETEGTIEAACRRIREAGAALRHSCIVLSSDIEDSGSTKQDGLIQLKKGNDCSWIYASAETESCVIVDPVAALSERIEHFVECQQYSVLAILDTHGHVDHESCRPLLGQVIASRSSAAVLDSDELGWPANLPSLTLGDGSSAEYFEISEGIVIARTFLPGHTEDSRGYFLGSLQEGKLPPEGVRFAFTGDLILIGGIGRTDFDVSDIESQYHSLRKLDRCIARHTVICPTHDYTSDFATTIGAEAEEPSLLHRVLADPPLGIDEFVAEKKSLDAELPPEIGESMLCGVIQDPTGSGSIDVAPEEFASFFREHADSLFVDVREPHEFSLSNHEEANEKDTSKLRRAPTNVPLSRLSNFLQDCLTARSEGREREIIFLCRSGSRSARAASIFRRVGLDQAWHVAGGIALSERPAATRDAR